MLNLSNPSSQRVVEMSKLLTVLLVLVAGTANAQDIERINPDGMTQPTSYTHVVRWERILFIAGQISTYLEGGERQLTALAEYLQDRQVQPDTGPVRLLDAQCGKGEFFETLFVVDNTEAVIQSVGDSNGGRSFADNHNRYAVGWKKPRR